MRTVGTGYQKAARNRSPGGNDGVGSPVGQNFVLGKARGPFDGHEGEFALALQLGQIAQIDENKAKPFLAEPAQRLCGPTFPRRKAGARQNRPDRTAAEPGMNAPPHHSGDVIEAEPGPLAQFGNQGFVPERGRLTEMMADMAAILDRRTPAPTPDCGLRDPITAGLTRHRPLRGPDLGPLRGVIVALA